MNTDSIDNTARDRRIFRGCFIALIATSFGFITRMLLLGRFAQDFNLDKVRTGELQGAGIWPFAISIILFSLIIDRVGYRIATIFSFVCYAGYLGLASAAYMAVHGADPASLHAAQERGFSLLYWGSILLGLGNGTVEAYINPLVATIFSKEKTKWLNKLHAGWPAGLVLGGLITIGMSSFTETGDWRLVLGLIAIPSVAAFAILVGAKFPVSERERAGVSYKEMLGEFGMFGAVIAFGLIFAQLGQVFALPLAVTAGLTLAVTIAFGLYTRSFGRPLLAILILVMMPLATTEIGTDGWISSLMEHPLHEAGFHPGWVLVYTSAIMMVLRFFGGAVAHRISPLGLLAASSALAVGGLLLLSRCASAPAIAIFGAATLYAVGKTFFWPTMLGVTAEQSPRGGALTLNAMGGIGMIAVGVIGFPFIGALQEKASSAHLAQHAPEVAAKVLSEKSYLLGGYSAIDPTKVSAVADAASAKAVAGANLAGQFEALAHIAVLPGLMLMAFVGLFLHFRSRGGYKPVTLATESKSSPTTGA